MAKKFKISSTDNLLFAFFSCWCLVDSINGLLLRNDLISISQIFKIFVAFIVIVRCQGNNAINNLLLGLMLYLCLYIVNVALHGEDVVSSVILVSKLMTSILFYYYFLQVLFADDKYFEQKAYLVLKWNFIFFAANMILGIMGFGYAAYGDVDDGIGSKGLFYAGNELSGVVAAVFPWVFYYIIRRGSIVFYFVSGAALLVLVYSLSTKSGIFATLLLFIMIAFFYGSKRIKVITVLSSIAVVFYIVLHIQALLGTDVAIVERFSFFLERDGLMGAMTAGRLDYWEEESVEFFRSDIFTKLLGLGGMRTVEMDPADSLLNCGFIGLFLLTVIYLKGFLKPFKHNNTNNPYRFVVFSSNVVLIAISVAAGHVLFSSMAGMLIALSNAMLCIRAKHTNSLLLSKSQLV